MRVYYQCHYLRTYMFISTIFLTCLLYISLHAPNAPALLNFFSSYQSTIPWNPPASYITPSVQFTVSPPSLFIPQSSIALPQLGYTRFAASNLYYAPAPFSLVPPIQLIPTINGDLLSLFRAEVIIPPLDAIPEYTYVVITTYPHDPTAFTQGLVFDNGFLYEGTGLYGSSSLRKVDLETATVLQILELAPEYFGEGITILGNRIIQLTWLSNIGFVYDKLTFELLQEFTYPTEGWGITHDGQNLIMSDGTSLLHFLDPITFEEIRQIEVFDAAGPVTMLNELEYIQGEIYANVWLTDRIARISPLTGQVVGWIDLTGLLSPADIVFPVNVLNGIAYDALNDRLFVTGKFWPKLFEIELLLL
ncbi:MAG: glutaminyl-peptide cyclotransferase [bacterium]